MIEDFSINSEFLDDRIIFKSSGSIVRPAGSSSTPSVLWSLTNTQTLPNPLGFGFPTIFQWSNTSDFANIFQMTAIDGSINFNFSPGLSGIFCAWVDDVNLYFRTVSGTVSSDTVYWRCLGLLRYDETSTVLPTSSGGNYPFLYNSEEGAPLFLSDHVFSRGDNNQVVLSYPHNATDVTCLAWYVSGSKYHQLSIAQLASLGQAKTAYIYPDGTNVYCDFPGEVTYSNSVYVRTYSNG